MYNFYIQFYATESDITVVDVDVVHKKIQYYYVYIKTHT